MNKNNVYKILREREWEEAQETGKIITELDKQDGFIHLSKAFQLTATLAFFFKDSNFLQLSQLDLAKIDNDQLIYEVQYPDQGNRKSTFPHLYSELMINQVSKSWTIRRGAFYLPEEVLQQAENGY
ncbi:DUF952 domain-containing protein [SAR86 cluster bacterium]|nr:DUF952 domain-containing protein [SAR86 cluster bacterium]